MKNTNKQKKWKPLIIVIWILFLAAASIGCFHLQKFRVNKAANTELLNQSEIISGQFTILVDTDFLSRAVFYDRLIPEVKALAFALEGYDDISQADDFLWDFVSTTDLTNLWIYDRDGNILFGSGVVPGESADPNYIRSVLDSKEYESVEILFDDKKMYHTVTYVDKKDSLLWGVNDKWLIYANDIFPETMKYVVGFFDWTKALQDISIGRSGTVLAVSKKDGSVLSFSDPDAKNKPVESLNIRIPGKDEVLSADRLQEEFSQTGEVKEIELDSVPYNATRMNIADDLFLVMFPVKKVEEEVIDETVVLMIPIALITFIGILYAFCLAACRSEESQNRNGRKKGSVLSIGKLKLGAILAVLLAFILSLYLEMHLTYAGMFQYTSTTAEDVMQKKNDSDKMLKALEEWSDSADLEKSRVASSILRYTDPGKADRQFISDLADCLYVKSIYVFDKDGKVAVTNASYDGIVLDKDSPFHALLEGVDSVVRQPDQQAASGDEGQTGTGEKQPVSGEGQLNAGVTMLDENDRVAGAVVIADDTYYPISDNLSFENVFQRVFLKDSTVVIAVDSENMRVKYYAQVDGSLLVSDWLQYDYSDVDLAALGMDEKIVEDHFNGELFALNNQYFASIRRNDNAFLMVLRPMLFIDTDKLLPVLYVTAVTLLFFILLIIITGRLKAIPAGDSEADDIQPAENRNPNQLTPAADTDKEEDDMFSLLGSLANNNKPYFEERWPSDGKKWKTKTPMEKFSTVVKLLCVITLIFLCIYVLIRGKDSLFYYMYAGEWSVGINLYSITTCIMEIVLLVLLKQIIHKVLYLIARASQSKAETICHLLNSFTGYILFIAGVFLILRTLGVDLTTISLTAGVAGIIFGIGCQNIVADILAGIIMTFEGMVCAGDFVSFNGQYGTIMSVGVRMTTLKYFSETTYIRNNEFKNFISMPAEETDRVIVYLFIDRNESITRVENIIYQEMPLIHENLSRILGREIKSPCYLGVQGIEDGGINLSFAVYCPGMYYVKAKRMMNRELLLMCERNGIRLGMPQIVVNEPAETPVSEPVETPVSKPVETPVSEPAETLKK